MRTITKTLLLLLVLAVAPASGYAIKILHGPYLQSVSETEATIVWTTDSQSVAWVELAPNDGTNFYAQERPRYYDTQIGIKRTDNIHAVTLRGLKPGTTYRYRVYAQEVLSHRGWHVNYGYVAATDVYTKAPLAFTTLDKSKAAASFLVVNDIHEHADRMKTLFNRADYKTKDLVFFNGDMLSLFDKEQKFWGGFMDTAVSMFAGEKPLYYVRGNHETRGQMADRFHRYVRPNDAHLYFTVEQGPMFFICLDTGEDKPDNDMEYAGITDYDNYRTQQAEWLRQVVASDAFKRARFRVVVAHIPPRYTPAAWHGDIEVREKFMPILNEAGINLMICGHLHKFEYTEPNSQLKFPILVNSNEAVVSAETQGNKLDVKIIELNGKISFHKVYNAL